MRAELVRSMRVSAAVATEGPCAVRPLFELVNMH